MLLPLSLLATLPIASVWAAPTCALQSSATPSTSASTDTSTDNSSSNSNGPAGEEVVATTWYAGWHAEQLPLSNLSWSKYSSVTYAFALTTPDPSEVALEDSDKALLPQFVEAAHQTNTKALLTIGGWTGSRYFSSAVASAESRDKFVDAVLGLRDQYNLDGIDFDWEYPNKQGIGCNVISPDDSQNFLLFLQALRSAVGEDFILSAATGITPFVGSDGNPMSDVSAFADVLDWIAIMNYDVWGSWSSTVGPNAPLDDTCAPQSQQEGSARSAVTAWTDAGFPANQIVLGVAAYGHSFKVSPSAAVSGSSLSLYPAFDKGQQPMGDSWDANATGTTDVCGVAQNGPSGIFNFWGMFESGFLTGNGTAADGIVSRFDECSQTPYAYNPTTGVEVSYDDPRSFAAKGQFINEAGLLGFAMWEAAGDYNDMLLDAISGAIGIEAVDC